MENGKIKHQPGRKECGKCKLFFFDRDLPSHRGKCLNCEKEGVKLAKKLSRFAKTPSVTKMSNSSK